jgi:hypothetical protein
MTYTAEEQRERYYANLEENRRKHREYARANRDKYNAARRKRRAENPEEVRAYEREQKRARPRPGVRRMGNHDDWTPEADAVMRQAQNDACYLCGGELGSEKIDIDHDHSCCPQGKSCRVCRRGLAHHRCNVIIGWAGDDPGMLRHIADALEAAQSAFAGRLAAAQDKGEQLCLSGIDD